MKTFSWVMRVGAVAIVCVGIGAADNAPRAVNNMEGHRSSLKATLTMADGTIHAVTLEGVGCPESMCSRVKARELENSIWLDGLASISGISRTDGPVNATLRFKDGAERNASIIATNRVLYVHRLFGFTEKVDLKSVSRIDFN